MVWLHHKGKLYINNEALVGKDDALVTKSIQIATQNIQVKPLPNYSKSFMQESRNYIIEILSSISTLDLSLLHAFSDQFQIESLKIIHLFGDGASLECNQWMDQFLEFFSLLETCSMEKVLPNRGKTLAILQAMTMGITHNAHISMLPCGYSSNLGPCLSMILHATFKLPELR